MIQYRLTKFTCIAISCIVIVGCAARLPDLSDAVPSRIKELPPPPPVQIPGLTAPETEDPSSTIQDSEKRSKNTDELVPVDGVVVPVPTSVKPEEKSIQD